MPQTSDREEVGVNRLTRLQRVMNLAREVAGDRVHQRQLFRAKVAGQLVSMLATMGVTAASLARKIGVSPAQMSRQLSGSANLTLDTLHTIAAAADLTVDVTFAPKAVVVTVNTVYVEQQRDFELRPKQAGGWAASATHNAELRVVP